MTGLDPKQFLQHVIRLALAELGDHLHSVAAEKLLIGTAVQESGLVYLHQLGGGGSAALGVYQMEPATHNDIWDNFLKYDSGLRYRLGARFTGPDRLIWDLKYATKMARLHYYRVKEALPAEDNIPAMAEYWKQYYNTRVGKGTEAKFLRRWNKLLDNHPNLW